MDLEKALSLLPHGPEFRFVDRLLALDPGKSATGVYLLKSDAAFLAGHFPGAPLMPAVLMIESIAQVAGVAAQTDPSVPALDDLRVAAIRQVKIHGSAMPGDKIQIEAKILGRMGGLVQASGLVSIGDEVLAEGQITLAGQSALQ